MTKEKPVLTIKVTGRLRPGHIPVPLLVKICEEAQTAINRQASALAGKLTVTPGRHRADVYQECTLDLIGIKRGSTTLQFVPAADQQSLLPVGIEAISKVGDAIRYIERGGRSATAPPFPVLDALNNLGEVFSGESGIKNLKWIVPAHNGTKGMKAEFNPASVQKLRTQLQPVLAASGAANVDQSSRPVEGTLELAEGKGRIVPTVGTPTVFSFGSDKASDVLKATRRPVRARVDPKSHKLEEIELAGLSSTSDFFIAKTVDQLICEQQVQPIEDISIFGSLSDDEVDSLIAEIHQARHN